MRLGPTLAPRLALYPRALPPPPAFGWTPDFAIRQLGPSAFTADLDETTLKPTTSATFYANTARPNNTSNGTSWALAEQAIWAALNDVSSGVHATIYVMGSADPNAPTIYPWSKAWRVGASANLVVSVVSDEAGTPGYAVSSTALVAGDGELGTWGLTADPGGPNVYEATLTTAPDRVIDGTVLDVDGVATKLTLQTSIANVEANPGSYYHAAGKLYVRTADSRAPSFPTLRPLKGGTCINGQINGTRTVYVERLGFEGGSGQAVYVQDGNLIIVDADVTHGQALGINVNTAGTLTNATRTLHAIRVRAIANGGDGIGYSAAGAGMTLHGFEWGCTYARNTSAAGSDQGGSAHRLLTNSAVRVVRLNPDCRENKSQGFADVGENVGANDNGCEVWIVGGSVADEAVGVYAGNGTKTWLHAVQMTGNTVDLKTDAAAGRIYLADMPLGSRTGDGVVQYFTP